MLTRRNSHSVAAFQLVAIHLLQKDQTTKRFGASPPRDAPPASLSFYVCPPRRVSYSFIFPRHHTHPIPLKSTWRLQSEACHVQFQKQFVPIAISLFPPHFIHLCHCDQRSSPQFPRCGGRDGFLHRRLP